MSRFDKIKLVYISTEIKDKLIEYCKKNNLVMYKFVSEAIKKAIEGEEK